MSGHMCASVEWLRSIGVLRVQWQPSGFAAIDARVNEPPSRDESQRMTQTSKDNWIALDTSRAPTFFYRRTQCASKVNRAIADCMARSTTGGASALPLGVELVLLLPNFGPVHVRCQNTGRLDCSCFFRNGEVIMDKRKWSQPNHKGLPEECPTERGCNDSLAAHPVSPRPSCFTSSILVPPISSISLNRTSNMILH